MYSAWKLLGFLKLERLYKYCRLRTYNYPLKSLWVYWIHICPSSNPPLLFIMFMCAQISTQARGDWSEIHFSWTVSMALESDALWRTSSRAGLPPSCSWCLSYLPLEAGFTPPCPLKTGLCVAPQHGRAAASWPWESPCLERLSHPTRAQHFHVWRLHWLFSNPNPTVLV